MSVAPTILVIDDDSSIRESLETILQDHGYRVLVAEDGEQGIQRALLERPNLIIVDMMMPRGSGFTVIERLKQHHQINIPVIMLTAHDSDHQRAYAECLGVDHYLRKPAKAYELLQVLVKMCPPPNGILPYAQPPGEKENKEPK